MELETRTCKECNEEKSIYEYYVKNGYRSRTCRECVRSKMSDPDKERRRTNRANWLKNNPDYQKNYSIKDSRIKGSDGGFIPIDLFAWNENKKGSSRKVVDITGLTFNKLTAMCFVGTDSRGRAWWKFRCECGEVKDLKSSNVKSGNTQSCGCGRIGDITGVKFGKLTAIKNTMTQLDSRKEYIWTCKCECGNTRDVPFSYLTTGNVTECRECAINSVKLANTTHGMSKTKEYRRFKSHRYRERYAGIIDEWTPLMERKLSEFFKSCVVCGGSERLQTDHVLPKSKGFGLKPGNAVKLCIHHNSFKSNKMPDELPEYFRDLVLDAANKFEIYWNDLKGIEWN